MNTYPHCTITQYLVNVNVSAKRQLGFSFSSLYDLKDDLSDLEDAFEDFEDFELDDFNVSEYDLDDYELLTDYDEDDKWGPYSAEAVLVLNAFNYKIYNLGMTEEQIADILNEIEVPGYESIDWNDIKLKDVEWNELNDDKERKRINSEGGNGSSSSGSTSGTTGGTVTTTQGSSSSGGLIGGIITVIILILIGVIIWKLVTRRRNRGGDRQPANITNITVETKPNMTT